MTSFHDNGLPAVEKLLATAEELAAIPSQDLRYQMEKLRGYRYALFEMHAPFRAGDRVELWQDYEIDPMAARGWVGYEEMMSAGATATVRSVDWFRHKDKARPGGYFSIAVVFDNEVRYTKWGSERKRYEHTGDDRHVFHFSHPERWWRTTWGTEWARAFTKGGRT